MAFYRKYRPQTIHELDNVKLRQKIYAVLRSKDLPHAFLFTGPKGLGKTSTARIIAKVINCEQPILKDGTIEPCNICQNCLSITKGTNMDVLEVDGASNRGIDEIRDLKEKITLSPIAANKKVYIIDEVHMLTTEAFNALLKTIEEPPEHVIFIFCTTEPHKVPATILSRCIHISLTKATQEELMRSLKRIAEGENLTINDDALITLSQLSEGGFRDAAKLLEEVSLMANGEKITKKFTEIISNTTNLSNHIHQLITTLSNRNTKQGLQTIKTITEEGMDIKFFMTQFIDNLHQLLLQKIGIEPVSKESLVTKFTLEELTTLISLFSNSFQNNNKYTVIPQMPLEIALIAWCTSASNKHTANGIKPTIHQLIRKQQAFKVAEILGKEQIIPISVQSPTHQQNEIPKNNDEKKSLLDNLIYRIKETNQSVAAVLRGCTILTLNDTVLVFETAYKFHKERLEEAKSKEIIEKFIKEITGKQIKITVNLK